MKKHIWLTILALMMIVFGSIVTVQAEVLAPYGEGQIGLQAVVLCDSLTVREQPSINTRAVRILHSEDRVIVTKQEDGWAQICISDAVDAGPEGWVKTDYIVIDPAWYRADSATPVYAWNDTSALKVGLLDSGTILPVLKEDGEWIVVGLRGASGWIHK